MADMRHFINVVRLLNLMESQMGFDPRWNDVEQEQFRLDNEHPHLLSGYCHLMAFALQEATGYDLGAVLDFDYDVETTVLCHAFVWHDRSRRIILDLKGLRTVDTMLEDFPSNEPDLQDTIDAGTLMKLGSGHTSMNADDRAKLAEAKAVTPWVLELAKLQIESGYLES